jgi:hypothetical protein
VVRSSRKAEESVRGATVGTKFPKIMTRTIEEKYKFLLSILEVSDLDFWENDGMIVLPKPIYFQFPSDGRTDVSVDEAVEHAMGYFYDNR